MSKQVYPTLKGSMDGKLTMWFSEEVFDDK